MFLGGVCNGYFVFVVQSSHIIICVVCVTAFFVKPLFIYGVLSMAIWFFFWFFLPKYAASLTSFLSLKCSNLATIGRG